MDTPITFAVNSGFTWLIVAMSIVGYGVTLKRIGQKWSLWIVLATGWTFLAITNTLLAVGIPIGKTETNALWLSSFVLVMASLLMLFLKLVQMSKSRHI
jgi:hypothetical protein